MQEHKTSPLIPQTGQSLGLFPTFSIVLKSSCCFIEAVDIIRHESEYTG